MGVMSTLPLGDSSTPLRPPRTPCLGAAEPRLRSQPLRGRNAKKASTATAGGAGRAGQQEGRWRAALGICTGSQQAREAPHVFAAAQPACKQRPQARAACSHPSAHLRRPPLLPPQRQLGRKRRRTRTAAQPASRCRLPRGWGLRRPAMSQGRALAQPGTTRRTCACRRPRLSRKGWCCRPPVQPAGVCLRCSRHIRRPCPACRCPAAQPLRHPSSRPQRVCPRHTRALRLCR